MRSIWLATIVAVLATMTTSVSCSVVSAPFARVYQTSAANGDRITLLPSVALSSSASASSGSVNATSFTLNQKASFQSLLGFGGAITEATVTTMAQMPAAAQAELIEAYFGASGNQYSIGRVPINSCDFSVNSWNFDPIVDDFALAHFDRNVTHEQQYLIPFMKRMQEASFYPVKIFGSPWSPPAWMKGNGAMDTSSTPGLRPEPQYHQVWADYISLWFTSFKAQGIRNLWGLTVQNEPAFDAPWEACVYSAADERDFLKGFLGPTMRKDHPEVKIMVWDHNKDLMVSWANTIYSDPAASQYVDGMGLHWYAGDQFANVATVNAAWPDKFLLATEATNYFGALDSFPDAEKYAHDIIGDLENGVVGWTDWNLVLNQFGGPNHLDNYCVAPIIANTTSGLLQIQPMYYYLGHFSRFLPPNGASVRIGHTNATESSALEITSFKVTRVAGDEIVVVALNEQSYDIEYTISTGNKQDFVINIPQHSIHTVVFDASLLNESSIDGVKI